MESCKQYKLSVKILSQNISIFKIDKMLANCPNKKFVPIGIISTINNVWEYCLPHPSSFFKLFDICQCES